jgi:hypothetical protein
MAFVDYRKRAAIGLVVTFAAMFGSLFLLFTLPGGLGVLFGFVVMGIALVAFVYSILNIVRFYRLGRN